MYIIVPLLAALSSNTPPWDFTPDHTSKCTSSPWPLRTLLYCKLPCMHSSSIGGISTSKIKSITHTWGKLRVQLCLALYYFRFLPCGQNGTHCLLLPRARELENNWAFYIYYISIFSMWEEKIFSRRRLNFPNDLNERALRSACRRLLVLGPVDVLCNANPLCEAVFYHNKIELIHVHS